MMNKSVFIINLTLIILLQLTHLVVNSAMAKPSLTVVSSISPIHSLVKDILGDQGVAELIIKKDSVHHFNIKPSTIRMLKKADIVFYIDDNLEQFFPAILSSLPTLTAVPLFDELLNEDAENSSIKKTQTEEKHEGDEGHGKHNKDHSHNHGVDLHVWLNTNYLKQMAQIIQKQLSALKPEQKKYFEKNATQLIQEIETLEAYVQKSLKSVNNKSIISLHNAYQYYADQWGLTIVDVVSISPEVSPSIKKIRKLRKQIESNKVKCLFKDPQFSDKTAQAIVGDLNVDIVLINPLGKVNQNHSQLIKNITDKFVGCLK